MTTEQDTPRPPDAKLPAKLAGHPSMRAVLARRAAGEAARPPRVIDAEWLRKLCVAAGADEAAAASLDHPDVAGEREHALAALPGTRTLVSLVEMERFPGRIWVVAHKTVAVAAGQGVMGLHRNVIHPRFGNFVLLATVLVDAEVSEYGERLDHSPCVDCKLCVAACPVGAIKKGGDFDFLACVTHNYREFMSGFTDWVQTVADSGDAADFRSRVTDPENASMWQSPAFKPSYKSGYCMAVCPAGEDVLGPYPQDRRRFMDTVLRPLQDKAETLYVLPGSDAQQYAERRFPHKPVKEVTGGWQPPAKQRPAAP